MSRPTQTRVRAALRICAVGQLCFFVAVAVAQGQRREQENQAEVVAAQQQVQLAALDRRVSVLEAIHPDALNEKINGLATTVGEMRTIGYGILVAVFVNLLTGSPRLPFRLRRQADREWIPDSEESP